MFSAVWLTVLFVLNKVALVQNCAPTMDVDTGPSTTTMMPPCVSNQDYDTSIIVPNLDGIDEVRAHDGICKKCDSGLTDYFYQGDTNDNVGEVGNVLEVTCPDMKKFCACDTDGVCYVIKGDITSIDINSYCSAPKKCAMYMLSYSSGDVYSDGLMTEDGSKVYVYADMFDSNSELKPFSSGAYPVVASSSCQGCDAIRHLQCYGPFMKVAT